MAMTIDVERVGGDPSVTVVTLDGEAEDESQRERLWGARRAISTAPPSCMPT